MRRQRNLLGPQGMGGMVSLWGASSIIRSVQYISGVITGSSTALTIAAVAPENAISIANGDSTTYSNISLGAWVYGSRVTAATTVTGTRGNWVGETAAICVIEFAPGIVRSLQTGSITIGINAATANGSITTVNMAKSLLIWQPYNGGDTISVNETIGVRATLNDPTTIIATRNTASVAYTSSGIYQLVEFF